jgi:NAD(P)-dependent dehydrogenase (short-subunit alcohol dehydrogenase family)
MGQFQLDKSMMPYLFKQGRLPEAWEMAAIIAFLLGDETAHVTKAAWNNDGGWSESS